MEEGEGTKDGGPAPSGGDSGNSKSIHGLQQRLSNESKGMALAIFLWNFSLTNGVAPLVTDPPRADFTPLQNSPFSQTPTLD